MEKKEFRLVDGLSTLTTIEVQYLERLRDIGELAIVDELVEQLQGGNDTATIDIGIGNLTIHYSGESIRFRFAPNAKFEEDVANACIHGTNLIDTRVESALRDRIVNTYKDLI